MNKRKLSLSILSASLVLGLALPTMVSCGGNTGNQPDSGVNGDQGTKPTVTIDSVKITDEEGLEPVLVVSDFSEFTLKADVKTSSTDKSAKKVKWSVDKPEIAQVTQGTVTIDKVTEDTPLTVTCTSTVDATKSASVTFTVKHTGVNLLKSSPVDLDTSAFIDEGKIKQIDPEANTSVILSDVFSTKWYVESEIRVQELSATDEFPKFGIMTGTSEYGAWQTGEDKYGLFFADLNKGSNNKWNNFSFVVNNDAMNDWDWAGNVDRNAHFTSTEKIETNKFFKVGLLRDGIDYYLYYGNSSNNYANYKAYKKITWNGIAADIPSYAWIGGFRTATEIKNVKAITDPAEVDKLFGNATSITLNKTGTQFLQNGKTMQLEAVIDPVTTKGLTWTSSDETAFTVSNTGLVTAVTSEIGRKATITARIGEGTNKVEATVEFQTEFENPVFLSTTAAGNWDRSHECDPTNPYVEGKFDNDGWLQFNGKGSTKWYAEVTIDATVDTEGVISTHPKYGLAAMNAPESGKAPNGDLVFITPDDGEQGLKLKRPLMLGMQRAEGKDDWNLPNPEAFEDVDYREPGKAFNIGLMRNGADYYFFVDGGLVRHRVLDSAFAADEPNLPGYHGWGIKGVKLSNFKYVEGAAAEEVIAKYTPRSTAKWDIRGDITMTDDANFTYGKLGTCNAFDNLNMMTYKEELKGDFDISYKISQYKGTATDWYWPKFKVVLNGDVIGYSASDKAGNGGPYKRIETCMQGNWQNSHPLGGAEYDVKAEHTVLIEVRAGRIKVKIDGGNYLVLEGKDVIERGLTPLGEKTGYKLEISGEKNSCQIKDFTITQR